MADTTQAVQNLNTITLQANQGGYVQFGRIIKVEVRNFKTKQKITFTNPLRIEFDFFKTIDEIEQASVGQIRIYNLSEDTHKFITEAGSEVKLSFGYGSMQTVKTLFYCAITSVHREQNDDTVSVLNVCANFMEYNFNTRVTEYNETTIAKEAMEIAQNIFNSVEVKIDLSDLPLDEQPFVAELLTTKKIVSLQNPNNGKTALRIFGDSRGFYAFNDHYPNGDIVTTFMIKPVAMTSYIEQAHGAYEKIKEVTDDESVTIETSRSKTTSDFNSIYTATDNSTSYIFSRDSGLLGTPQQQVQIVDVPENWNIGTNEQVTRKGEETIAKKQQKEAERYSKWKKKKDDGKTVKDFKPRKLGKKQISRTFVRVKALINPSVKPQSHVTLNSELSEYDGVYRVRNITYKGTNGSGDCYMEMYCEDNSGVRDTDLSEEQKKQIQEQSTDEAPQLTGKLGDGLEDGVSVEGGEE